MFANIQAEIAGRAVSAVKENHITARKLVRRLKNSVCESMGLYEIRLRLYLWELSGIARQKMAKYALNSVVAGKTALLIAAFCIFAAGGIMMAWQSVNGVGKGVQTLNAAGFESFPRPSHPGPRLIGRPRQAGFNGYEPPRRTGKFVSAKPEMSRHNFSAKDAIKAHARIVCSPSE